jgi:hypothetical protein
VIAARRALTKVAREVSAKERGFDLSRRALEGAVRAREATEAQRAAERLKTTRARERRDQADAEDRWSHSGSLACPPAGLTVGGPDGRASGRGARPERRRRR